MADDVDNATDEVTAFGAAAYWTGVRDRRLPGDPADPKWLDLRRTMVTASDVAAIMGEDEYRSPMAVYVSKLLPRETPEIPTLDGGMVWGSVFEQPMLEYVARFHRWQYRRGGFLLASRAHPFMGATLDAEVDRGQGWVPLEGKTTELLGRWDEDQQELPTRVLLQVQAQLLVTGAPVAPVFGLVRRNKSHLVDVYPAPELHEIMLEVCREFIRRVHDKDPPPAMPGREKQDAEALAKLYPLEDGRVVALPPEAVEWTRRHQQLTEKIGELKKEKDHIRNLLKSHIGSATYGLLPEPVGNRSCWRWETSVREERVTKASESRGLIAMKDPPRGAPKYLAAPPAKNELLAQLEESVSEDAQGNVVPIRIGKARKKSRR